jgi:hypothetical protein
MKIEPGKFYITRDGRKARIYATDSGHERYPIHGACLEEESFWSQESWKAAGDARDGIQHHSDLISPWVEKPVVDWTAMPDGAIAVAKGKDGTWRAYNRKPEYSAEYGWLHAGTNIGNGCWHLYPQHTPTFTGDWKDSLVSRP